MRLNRWWWRVPAGAVAFALAALLPLAASSANPLVTVDCEQFPQHPECRPSAGTTTPGETATNASGEMICRYQGERVPCQNEDGWFRDGCYYKRLEGRGPSTRDGQQGYWYQPTCIGDDLGEDGELQRPAVWIADAEAPGVAELARVAVSRLVLPRPEVVLSPAPPAPQLVGLPVWLWLPVGWWEADRSATASVPGVSVTAVAEPTQVRWEMGDGGRVVCTGSGTAWMVGMDPRGESPDCGYVYGWPSAGEPDGRYTVTVTVSWEVTWSGGGLSGSVGPLFSTAAEQVQVVEAQTVVTGG